MKVREVIRMVERDGWVLARHKGTSHREYRHPVKTGNVTIAGNPGDEIDKGTLNRSCVRRG